MSRYIAVCCQSEFEFAFDYDPSSTISIFDVKFFVINVSRENKNCSVREMSIYSMDSSKTSDSFKKKKLFFEDYISKEDVETVVRKAFEPGVEILNYHVRSFSEEKLGFMGAHRHLVITFRRKNNPQKEMQTFFLKSVPYDIEDQVSVINESKTFYKEENFYKHIAPEFMKCMKDKSWMAQCYLLKGDLMIFEDVKSRNFSMRDKILDDAHVRSALGGLAKLHACSMLVEKKLGQSLVKLFPEILAETLFVREGIFSNYIRTGLDVAVAVAKQLCLDGSRFSEIIERVFEITLPGDSAPARRRVICHGDSKSYNFMFDDSKPVPKCVLVDFQLIRYVPPMMDVLQFLYLSTRKEYRDKFEVDLLKYYHKILCETLRDNDMEIKLPCFTEIQQEYEELRFIGLITAVLYAPQIYMEGTMCADITKDSEGFSMFLFGDRVDLVLSVMEKDSFYKDLLTEIVTELSEKSQQFFSTKK